MNEYWEKTKDLLRPKEIVRDLQGIDFAKLKSAGIRALLLDIDDTLIPRNVNDVSPLIFDWVMARQEEGFRLCLTSNSRHPLRVKEIGKSLNLPALHLSFKPLPFAFWKSLSILEAKPEETAMIGDQLFMDILGANLLKIYSIFIWHKKTEDYWERKMMRRAEDWCLSKLGY